MRYPSGQEVKLGDEVRMPDGDRGVVVFCIDRDEYSDQYPKEQWSYLRRGAMVEFAASGLVHFSEDDPDLQLVKAA
jgi:hypothetical protein